jgi:thymidylate synthase (FAD)
MGPSPKLYILSRPALTEEIGHFLSNEGASWRTSPAATVAEALTEFAGRICYMSFGDKQSCKTNAEYIANLVDQGHESVLEHVNWTFLLTGVSRAFTHQLVRHRPGFAYSQLSQQYHDEAHADFVQPYGLEKYPAALDSWSKAMQTAAAAYTAIVGALEADAQEAQSEVSRKEMSRAIRSAARSVLPNATETKIVVTANARALRHFLLVRGSILGDFEMRAVSALIYKMLHSEAPSFVADFKAGALADGSAIIERTWGTTPQ